MYQLLIRLLAFQFTIIRILFKSKNDLVLETIELRQQLKLPFGSRPGFPKRTRNPKQTI